MLRFFHSLSFTDTELLKNGLSTRPSSLLSRSDFPKNLFHGKVSRILWRKTEDQVRKYELDQRLRLLWRVFPCDHNSIFYFILFSFSPLSPTMQQTSPFESYLFHVISREPMLPRYEFLAGKCDHPWTALNRSNERIYVRQFNGRRVTWRHSGTRYRAIFMRGEIRG